MPLPRKPSLRALASPAVFVVVAFLVRFWYLYGFFHAFEQPSILTNAQFGAETGAVAASIASGHGFSSPLHLVRTGATAWFSPIYPYLLAGVFKLFGIYSYKSNIVIRFIDISFSAFTCWPIYAIGRRAFGKAVGIFAAAAWAFLPGAIFFSVGWVWDTSLATLWMALLFAATLAIRGSGNFRHWAGYGALWAAGAMINPSLVSVLPFLAAWAIWPLRSDVARAARLALISAVVFAAGMAPWTIRNAIVFHAFIPMRSNFGLEFWLGNNPNVLDSCACSPNHPSGEDKAQAALFARMGEIPYMREKQREALSFLRTHPFDAARYTFRRFEYTWLGVSDPPEDIWSSLPWNLKLMLAWDCLFSVLSFLGVLFACRSQSEAGPAFAWVLLIFPIVFYITHTSDRYRHPIDPIMLLLTAYAITRLCALAASRFRPLSGTAPPRVGALSS